MMYSTIRWNFIGVILLFSFIMIGCSDGHSPSVTSPGTVQDETEKESSSNRVMWGLWDIALDPANLTANANPVDNRDVQAHFNITDMLSPPSCDDCLEIAVTGFNTITRIMDLDITLKNPYAISGYDVRGILYTTQYGHTIIDADGWTGLFDIAGGDTINPFMVFATDQPYRKFSGGYEDTVGYKVYIPKPPQYWAIQYAVTASWPGNCKEPYAIEDFMQDILFEDVGSETEVWVDVMDWQDDVSEVEIAAPEITGDDSTLLALLSGSTWGATITNTEGVPAGKFGVRISATSLTAPGVQLHKHVELTVSEKAPINPEDITPPHLNFAPQDVRYAGDYLYVAGHVTGTHIFDMTDPLNPVW